MAQDIKRLKFSGDLANLKHIKRKNAEAFLQNVISDDGLIKKSFYWVSLEDRRNSEIKYIE